MYLRKVFTIFSICFGLGFNSCQKDVSVSWLDYAEDAILMGYYKNDCFEGYVFELVGNSPVRPLTYARSLPEASEQYSYVNFPIKVRMIYRTVKDSCLTSSDVIEIDKIEIVQ